MLVSKLFAFLVICSVITVASSGPVVYAACLTICTAACGVGVIVGTGGIGAVAAPGCFQACMAGCAITGIAPTP
ncbi:unnamed protein product, partial [Mesorhabditis belari]|uniref:Uncharacterized protein n=1 Tax=Mesorhabditis belari TaxID=2138241 RepID=A0AAF3EK75_9BILA